MLQERLLAWQQDDEAPTYLLCPATLEVYRAPNRALQHDYRVPVPMDFGIFEDMAGVGCLSAERFLNHERMAATGFESSQILAVRLKTESDAVGGDTAYAWASRMVTTVPPTSLLPPDLHGCPVGHEFLWLWPPGKAWNAFLTRKERQRLHPSERLAGIDTAEPSVRHRMAHPGMMLGPDDVPGCVRVDSSELTALQRFFVASIKPQQTLFSRRPVTEDWTERVTKMTDENQCRIPSHWGNKRRRAPLLDLSERALPQKRPCAEATTPAAPATNNNPSRRRVRTRALAAYEREQGEGSAEMARRLFGKVSPARRVRELALDENAIHAHEHALSARAAQLWDQFERRSRRLRNARWADLPSELLVRIVCVHLGEELAATTAQARASICTMRLVSRGTCAVVDRFVGAQLHDIDEACARCFWSKGPPAAGPSPGHVGARARALGMHPEDVLRLSLRQRLIPAREQTADSIPPAALPFCPSVVPDWTAYLRRRAEREARHGARSIVVKPSASATAQFRAVVYSLRALNPSVNGPRYDEKDAPRDDSPLDGLVVAAGELDVRERMLEVACV